MRNQYTGSKEKSIIMQQFIEFGLRHWELLLPFFIVLLILIGLEVRNRFTGFPQLSTSEVTRLINREDALILDIRDSKNFDKGHIIGALNIVDVEANAEKLKKYKTKPIVIVFSVGQTPAKTADLLLKHGFEDISILKGGIASWQSAGLPLVKG